LQYLVSEALCLLWRQCRSLLLHVLFEIVLEVLEYQVELLLGEQHFFEFDDIGMLEVLQEGDLSDSCTGDAIVLLLKSDFLDGNYLIGLGVLRLVDDTIGTLS